MIKLRYFLLVVFVSFLCFSVVSSAETIQPGVDGTGYSWSGSEFDQLSITASGEYEFADKTFTATTVNVNVGGVSLDGTNGNVIRINGRNDLDLKNINIYIEDENYSGSVISACNNILTSSIFVKSSQSVTGIGGLYQCRQLNENDLINLEITFK